MNESLFIEQGRDRLVAEPQGEAINVYVSEGTPEFERCIAMTPDQADELALHLSKLASRLRDRIAKRKADQKLVEENRYLLGVLSGALVALEQEEPGVDQARSLLMDANGVTA